MITLLVPIFSMFAILSEQALAHGKKHHHASEHDDIAEPRESMVQPAQDQRAAVLAEIGITFLQDIRPVFEKKCADCHSDKTTYPWYHSLPGLKQLIENDIAEGRSHLDFSGGFPFRSHGTPEEDLKAIREATESRSMPPRSYLLMHSDRELSEADAKAIINWADSSLVKLRAPR